MSDRIDRAARVIADRTGVSRDMADGFAEEAAINPTKLARALDEAGLLAPAPLREEWACRYKRRGGRTTIRREDSEVDARSWAASAGDEILRRYVSDWIPVDRAEGDGRADR